MTEKSDESILLLNDQGCPTNLNIFPALTKIISNDTRKLVANFEAFKFTSSPIVRFSIVVQFCEGVCPKVLYYYSFYGKFHYKLSFRSIVKLRKIRAGKKDRLIQNSIQ